MLIDVQFNPARNPWPALRDATLAAESVGFGAAWVYDHLAGRSLGGDGMLETFTLLGALSATTSSIGLGTLVANVANRELGVLAVAVASVTAIADRPMLVGIGAGTSPTGRWAAEMHTVGQPVEPSLRGRHARVERALDLFDVMWSADRGAEWGTFPLPHHQPQVIVGVGSVALAEIAGRRADGVNVWWQHPRRDELLTAARTAFDRSGRVQPFTLTTWVRWDDALLDPANGQRRAMAQRDIDRLVLAELGPVDPGHIASLRPSVES